MDTGIGIGRDVNGVMEMVWQCELVNVAIAMHCNLRPPDAAPVPIRFNFVAHAKFEVV